MTKSQRWPLTLLGSIVLFLLLVTVCFAVGLLSLGCAGGESLSSPQGAPDLGEKRIEKTDLADALDDLAPLREPSDLAPVASSSFDLAPPNTMIDLSPRPDLAQLMQPDLAPQCTPVGGACNAACCRDPLPGSVDNDTTCEASRCCATSLIGNGCSGGHFKWCVNCGAGWACGACQ